LPYHYGYYDYNRRRRNHTTIINNNIIINPTPIPTPTPGGVRRRFDRKPIEFDVPPTGVVVVDAKSFGKGKKGFWIAPPELANDVLSKSPPEINNLPILPTHEDFKNKVDSVRIERQVRTGATDRKIGVSMDDNLRKERIHGNRPPIDRSPPNESKEKEEVIKERRDTGAVKREPRPIIRQDNIYTDPSKSPPQEAPSENSPIRPRDKKPDNERNDKPVHKPRDNNNDREKPPPSYSPPDRQDREEQPRHQPPPRPEPPKPKADPQPPKQESKPRPENRKVEQPK
jgi:hypothetical protein